MERRSSCFLDAQGGKSPPVGQSMTELSDTFIKALPDLTLVVRRDGLIVSNLGGREVGVPTHPGALCGKKLHDVWPVSVATELSRLARRALKGRSQADGCFHQEQARI